MLVKAKIWGLRIHSRLIVYALFINSVFCCHIDFNALKPVVVVDVVMLDSSYFGGLIWRKVMGKFDCETFWLRLLCFVCLLFLTSDRRRRGTHQTTKKLSTMQLTSHLFVRLRHKLKIGLVGKKYQSWEHISTPEAFQK